MLGASADETPYVGHTAGFHRGLANEWKRGRENGGAAASALKSGMAHRDEAEQLAQEGDNAMVAEKYEEAAQFWDKAATKMRQASLDFAYHVRLLATKKNRHS